MNIHSEYSFLPDGSVLPDKNVKVLGIYPEGFYFLIHQHNTVQYALLGSCPNGLNNNLIDEIAARKPAFQIGEINNVSLLPDSFVLVPDELLNRSTDKDLIGFCHVLPADYYLIKTKVEMAGATIVSAVPTRTMESLKQMNQNWSVDDMAAAWLNKITCKGVHAFILPSRFLLAIFDGGKLQLFNFFHYADKNDFLFYLLGAVKSCNIDPAMTEIYLSGEISPASSLAQSLDSYFFEVLYDAVPCNGSPDERIISSMLFPLF